MYNIMIVDDEEKIVSFIKESLYLEGFNTIVAYLISSIHHIQVLQHILDH